MKPKSMSVITHKQLPLFLIVGLLLSSLLFGINFLIKPELPWLMFARSLVIVAGMTWALSYDGYKVLRLAATSTFVGVVAALMLAWPSAASEMLLIITVFALHCFHQVYHQHRRLDITYKHYFGGVWNSVCLIISAIIFTLIASVLLWLWAALLSAIGIDYFRKLFGSAAFRWFIVPIFLIIGLYVTLINAKVVYYLRLVLLGFGKILLPLLTLIGVVYFFYLGFGLFDKPLLASSLGGLQYSQLGFILICFEFVGIILINAVYQDGSHVDDIKQWYRWIVQVLIVTLLFMAVLEMVLFFKQVDNFLRMSNFTQMIVSCMLFVYVVSYAVVSFSRPKPWLKKLGPTNIVLALIFIAVIFLLNNPIFSSLELIKKPQPRVVITPPHYDLARANLAWVDQQVLAGQKPVLLGFAHNKPLHACQGLFKGQQIPGQLFDNKCIITVKDQVIVMTQYRVLVGNGKIAWLPRFSGTMRGTNFAIRGNGGQGKPTTICRTIAANRIQIGRVGDYACQIAVDGHVQTVRTYQVLYASRK